MNILADGALVPCGCAPPGHATVAFRPGQMHVGWNSELFRRTRKRLAFSSGNGHASAAEARLFDCCAKCPVGAVQRYQTIPEYYTILGHATRLKGNLRRRKLENLEALQTAARSGADRIDAMPASAGIDPSSRCNLSCPGCPAGRGDVRLRPEMMDPATFETIINEIGPTLLLMEMNRSGEPLINPDTPAMIEIASRRHGILTRISTNLSMPLTDSQLESLVTACLHHIVIKADDVAQENYEQYRRGGNIDVVADNLRRLVAIRRSSRSRYPRITWQAIRFNFNQNRSDLVERQARMWGADRFLMLPGRLSPATPELMPGIGRQSSEQTRPRPIVSAVCSPSDLGPGSRFQLSVTMLNDLPGRIIPAERDGEPNPIRIGVKLVDENGNYLENIGRITIDQTLKPGEKATFRGKLTLPNDPPLLARADAIQVDLVAEFLYWFEDQSQIQTIPLKLKINGRNGNGNGSRHDISPKLQTAT